jgi:hypothetical protein
MSGAPWRIQVESARAATIGPIKSPVQFKGLPHLPLKPSF